MFEELKRDLEGSVRTFALVEPNKARWQMRDALEGILQKHSILDAEIIIAQAGGWKISVDILFADGKRYECKLVTESAKFSELQPEAKV